jgi:hypothetical protein
LKRGGSHAEKHQDVDDEELIGTGHDPIVHHRKSDDCINLLGNELYELLMPRVNYTARCLFNVEKH